ncbi:hypothetical protein NDU88_002983 [Pleurodeles waltl]|uniref:Uncharacterized protein n=1 Tax=Pleurodeles waltl TaxID=8319 RepID=A0AAV7Q8C7_PLEWA|nr:hypothetical protein NDU88_002983 [Pleurodeles waltl]
MSDQGGRCVIKNLTVLEKQDHHTAEVDWFTKKGATLRMRCELPSTLSNTGQQVFHKLRDLDDPLGRLGERDVYLETVAKVFSYDVLISGFQDDILVPGQTPDEHNAFLEYVLSILKDNGMTDVKNEHFHPESRLFLLDNYFYWDTTKVQLDLNYQGGITY